MLSFLFLFLFFLNSGYLFIYFPVDELSLVEIELKKAHCREKALKVTYSLFLQASVFCYHVTLWVLI